VYEALLFSEEGTTEGLINISWLSVMWHDNVWKSPAI